MKATKTRILCTLTAALLLSAMTACGGTESSTGSTADSTPQTESSATENSHTESSAAETPTGVLSYSYKANGTEIAINAESDPIVAALGTPASTFEAPSCAFTGISYTYTYAGFTLETYPNPDDSKNHVYAVTLTDDTVQTAEGLKVGDSSDTVLAKCGDPDSKTNAVIVYKSEGCALQFFTEDGKVTSIVYTYQ